MASISQAVSSTILDVFIVIYLFGTVGRRMRRSVVNPNHSSKVRVEEMHSDEGASGHPKRLKHVLTWPGS
jgi:hypothetical protein